MIGVYLAILVGWPLLAMSTSPEDMARLGNLGRAERVMVYLQTAGMLWGVFLLVWTAQWVAREPLSGLGFTQPALTDPLIGFVFLIMANLILNGLAAGLVALGFPEPDKSVHALLPRDFVEGSVWVLLSISAGVCEEGVFRGFLLLRGRAWLRRWTIAILASSIAFGAGHVYQGSTGAVLIGIYGVLFCLLRLWRGSLWPGVWAHIWQDIGAMAFAGSLG